STFFFSSRRRHTRFSRDWSSDVCSSDLLLHAKLVFRPDERKEKIDRNRLDLVVIAQLARQQPDLIVIKGLQYGPAVIDTFVEFRSEERRVGKEWRSRGWPQERNQNSSIV